MSKKEMRKQMMEKSFATGNLEDEIKELRKRQQSSPEDVLTITVTCSGLFSLVCCE